MNEIFDSEQAPEQLSSLERALEDLVGTLSNLSGRAEAITEESGALVLAQYLTLRTELDAEYNRHGEPVVQPGTVDDYELVSAELVLREVVPFSTSELESLRRVRITSPLVLSAELRDAHTEPVRRMTQWIAAPPDRFIYSPKLLRVAAERLARHQAP